MSLPAVDALLAMQARLDHVLDALVVPVSLARCVLPSAANAVLADPIDLLADVLPGEQRDDAHPADARLQEATARSARRPSRAPHGSPIPPGSTASVPREPAGGQAALAHVRAGPEDERPRTPGHPPGGSHGDVHRRSAGAGTYPAGDPSRVRGPVPARDTAEVADLVARGAGIHGWSHAPAPDGRAVKPWDTADAPGRAGDGARARREAQEPDNVSARETTVRRDRLPPPDSVVASAGPRSASTDGSAPPMPAGRLRLSRDPGRGAAVLRAHLDGPGSSTGTLSPPHASSHTRPAGPASARGPAAAPAWEHDANPLDTATAASVDDLYEAVVDRLRLDVLRTYGTTEG